MSVDMIVRRNGDYRDPRLVALRREGVPLLKKHGAISHKIGAYHSGPYTGQMYVVLGYPDVPTQQQALQKMANDPDWKRIGDEIEKLAPILEVSVATVAEEQ
jgi:hypothetical protein